MTQLAKARAKTSPISTLHRTNGYLDDVTMLFKAKKLQFQDSDKHHENSGSYSMLDDVKNDRDEE